MFDEFLNHRCDIYHLIQGEEDAGYGIRKSNVPVHEDTPSLTDVPCHFYVRQSSLQIVQDKPYSAVSGDVKLALSIGTDIRMNDLVCDRRTGFMYRADVPNEIHGHHISVLLHREGGLKGAI
jgi:hypothetical protein